MSDEASNIVINLRPIDQMRLDQLRERTETALTSDNVWYIHTVLAQCFLPCYRAPPAQSARPARVGRGETACAGPAHHHPFSSRAAPDSPTRRAFPRTARVACEREPLVARGMPGAVAHRVPTPQARTSGSRARHGRGERHRP